MNKIVFAFTVFTFSVFTLSAQFWLPTQEKSLKVEGRILLVEQADFECNPAIVEHLKKHWTLNSEIKGMTAEEINALLTPENASKYLVLTGDAKQESRTVQGKNQFAEIQSIILYPGENAGNRNNADLDREWIFKLGLPSCLVSEEEVLFLSQHMYKYISSMWDKPKSGNRKKSKIPPASTLSLKEKTLLIPADICEVDEAMIGKYYKTSFKLASRDEIKSAINNKQKGSAYLTVLWSDHKFEWTTFAIDCETGEVLAFARNSDFKESIAKKSFDANTEYLSIYRSKSKINLMGIKYLGKAITKAETAR
ncbi:MAG: hypothetical protein CL840_08835 [Crocinitomicaceae bacterium]|nr:hypothetical protein [Crocinitomicaceae bacterium]|tara:strand:- start:62747 stop:63673 length:927 start_codon:yes stop_codon:yes gene_type:complete